MKLQKIAPESRRTYLICAALFLATLALYWPVRNFEYVNFDDQAYISTNWLIQQGLTIKGFIWSFKEAHFANWHPLIWVSYMIECEFFGLNSRVQHLDNAILHAANGVILFLLLRKATGLMGRSMFVAALFLFHPLRVESVAWVTERKDVLSGLFFMLTLWTYVQYNQNKKEVSTPPRKSSSYFWLAVIFFGLGLMAKPMLVTVPFLLLLLDCWPLQRLELTDVRSWLKLTVEKWPFFALALVFCILTYLTQKAGGAVKSSNSTGRLQSAVMSLPAYLGKQFWPSDLNILYLMPPGWSWYRIVMALAITVTISVVAFWRWRIWPWLATGWFWFLGTMLPVTGLVAIGRHFITDRYTYLPSIGLGLVITWGVSELWKKGARRDAVLNGLAIGTIVLCGVLSRAQIMVWQNSRTLWEHALRFDVNNYIAHNSLGLYQLDHNEVSAARREFELTVKIYPKLTEAWNNLGILAMRDKDYGRAADLFQQAALINTSDTLSLANLGNAFRLLHDYTNAESVLKKAVQIDPEFLPALSALATFYDDIGKFDLAIPCYQKMLEYRPQDPLNQCNLAIDLMACGRLPEAMPHYEYALTLDPKNPGFHYYHGTALLQLGRLADGIGELRATLQLDPKYLAALNDLSWMEATHPDAALRNGKEAVELAERACQLTDHKNARALSSLDAAYAECGRFPEAIAAAEKTRAAFVAMGAAGFVNKTDIRLQLYRANRPFRS